MAEEQKEEVYHAVWADHLRHSPDPNRVSRRQIPSPGEFNPLSRETRLAPADSTRDVSAQIEAPNAAFPTAQGPGTEPSYYDVPILKQPVWKWQIASYFYLGGISGGAYVLGRMAERAGGARYRKLARVASYVALGSIVPCPGLLIWDLGDPKRFHHMLRVWKPGTPMNLGTWAITAYSGMATFEVVRQYLIREQRRLRHREISQLRRLMDSGTLLAVHDAAGIPFALLVASYTGVLLSCTSNPLWCKNPWLAPLFAASAASTGAEALNLAMDATAEAPDDEQCQDILQRIDTVAHIVELLTMRGFLRYAGEKANTLRHGKMKKYHQLSTGAIVAAEVLKRLPVPKGFEQTRRVLCSTLGLVGGFALRWSMIFGGHEAAADPHTSRLASRPE